MISKGKAFNGIALDMGAASIRIMHGRLVEGIISYRELKRFRNGTIHLEGHDRWDLERIVREVLLGLDKAVGEAGEPFESIGVDSWGVDYVVLDEEGALAGPAVSYRDERTLGMKEKWNRWMSGEETFRRTGINYNVFNTLYQLLAVRESGELDRAARILFMPGYMHHVFSGSGKNELTIASTSQLLRVEDNRWDTTILGHLKLDPGILGEVIEPGTVQGELSLPGKGNTGISDVAVCGHDTASVVVSIPSAREDFAFISAGTWCIVGIESLSPLISDEAFQLGITNERGYGNAYRALKNITGLWLMQGLKEGLPADTSFSDMERMIAGGSGTRLVIEPENDLFYRPGDMRTAFDTFFRNSGQDLPVEFSEYLQCAYDSLCFSFRYYIEKLQYLSGKPVEVIHVLGGGSQSRILNQRIATICEKSVISGPVEGATLGNIMVQAMAVGAIRDLYEGRELVERSCRVMNFQPEGMNRELRDRYELFLGFKANEQES